MALTKAEPRYELSPQYRSAFLAGQNAKRNDKNPYRSSPQHVSLDGKCYSADLNYHKAWAAGFERSHPRTAEVRKLALQA